MAPTDLPQALYAIHSVTQRLASTPVARLPHVVPSLASLISTCGDVLATVDGQKQRKSSPDAAVLAHKLKTQISTLLQDKSKEARWSAVVLIKAFIEAGNLSVLQGSEKWVRALLGLIGRPEPSTTKKLSIIVLTRIFLLSQEHQTIVRELTTPSIADFFTICLRLVEDKKGHDTHRSNANDLLLPTILWAFGKLLPHHPTACRPFVGQLRALILPLIAFTPSDISLNENSSKFNRPPCSEITAQRARQVLVLLNGCAAKNTQGQEWAQSLVRTVQMTHSTADSVFRALQEDWEPTDQIDCSGRTDQFTLTGTVRSHENELELPSWNGISAGLERLNGLLLTVQAHLIFPATSTTSTPIGKLVDLVDRVLSALPPQDNPSADSIQATRIKAEIGKDERETLWTWLPQLHVSALGLLERLILRFREGLVAIEHQLLRHVLWTFEHENSHTQVREAVYRVVALMLANCGSGVPHMVASLLNFCLRRCCKELIPIQEEPNSTNADIAKLKAPADKMIMNADACVKSTGSSSVDMYGPSEVRRAAEELLHAALAHLPLGFLPVSVRCKIDQTAVLIQSNLLLQASVLHPSFRRKGTQLASVMPMLARQFPQDHGTEALIRPRMPQVQQNTDNLSVDSDRADVNPEDSPSNAARRFSTASQSNPNVAYPVSMEPEQYEPIGSKSVSPPGHFSRTENVAASSLSPQPQKEPKIIVPAKRSLDLETGNITADVAEGSERFLVPSNEPASKRLHAGTSDRSVSPAIEDDNPPTVATDPPHISNQPEADLSAQFEPLANLHTTKESMNDDDSDDSSIPVLDPTWATDDEDEDEDEVHEEDEEQG
ncbi:MAG: hypothetical protein Q9182_007406 [Xanthomendoza sp. 2 TL-2023]